MKKRILSIECAGLGYDIVAANPEFSLASGFNFSAMLPPFPAVTCTSQATFRTAASPVEHKIVCNGRYDKRSFKVDFWNQSSSLMQTDTRIWDTLQSKGGSAAVLFHQQSLGDSCKLVLSPAPIHKHHGGMIQACYTQPPELEKQLISAVGKPFTLFNYWGPAASKKSSDWISRATVEVMKDYQPDFLAVYLPHMDYCQQKYGPDNLQVTTKELSVLAGFLSRIIAAAEHFDYEVIIWGDYGIVPVKRYLAPNKILRDENLFNVRNIKGGMTYPDIYSSEAFAMCDHQIAHIYLKDKNNLEKVRKLFSAMPGVARVAGPDVFGLPTDESGDLVLEAEADCWFAYKWWDNDAEAPDYASHVDIHNKIGFDACELFWKIPFISINTDCSLPKGSHGRADVAAAFAASPALKERLEADNLLQLSQSLEKVLARIR